jgi:putative intracellular protease/amidase
VRSIAQAGKLVACICRDALPAANTGIVRGRHITGFVGDSELSAEPYPEPAVERTVVGSSGIWENRKVVVDGNFISARHPRDIKFLTAAVVQHLWPGAKLSPFDDGFTTE